ncbi:MAG TPA: flagellar basal body rod protein FlgB [Candidatus Kryptobacter bacterium]|nr:flagellar basal body rod protein FlgB [Candidatus Kryptobacter bacterium]
MKIDFLDRSRVPLLEKELDLFAVRNKAIANNIANIASPGYKRVDVSFQGELSKAIANSQNDVDLSQNVENVDPQIEVDRSGFLASGANNVNIDQEMADLAKNQLQFKLAARLMTDTFTLIDKSINGD